MTYDAFEVSAETGEPIELYRFVQGGDTYEYTSGEDELTVDSITYEPIPISRSKLLQGSGDKKNILDIEVPGSNPFALQYLSSVPGEIATLIIRRVHRADFPGPEVIKVFEGKVRSVSFSKNAKKGRIAVLPLISATARTIPRYTYMGMCNNVLGDDNCKADLNDAAWLLSNALVTTVASNVITVTGASGFSDGWFVPGYVEFNNGTDFRMVLDHTGDDLTLLLPFPTDITGEMVDVIAGCAHDTNACHTKFFTTEDVASNLINYGGFWEVPTQNPFTKGLW